MSEEAAVQEEAAEPAAAPAAAAQAPAESGNWYDSLPDTMREDPNITKFSSVETMASSWLNAQQMIGRDKIPMPVTDDDWSDVYTRLGKPESAELYQIAAPEGIEIDDVRQGAFKEMAHNAGFNQGQMEKASEFYFNMLAEDSKASNDAIESHLAETSTALKAEWGEKFDHNLAVSERVIDEFGGDDFREFMTLDVSELPKGTQLNNIPQVIKMLAAVGNGMIEDNKLEGLAPSGQTPAEMEDERNSLMAHPAYTDKRHPEHAAVLKKVTALFDKQFA